MKKHPNGIYTLFLTELWERFSYYGLTAILMLYIHQEFGLSEKEAYLIYGAYATLVYISPILFAWLVDHYIGQFQATLWGAVYIISGHFVMVIPDKQYFYFYLGHWLSSLLNNQKITHGSIRTFCVSSVVPELNQAIKGACENYFGHAPLWVNQELKPRMPLLIDNPEELGDDRLVNSYTAYKKFGGPVIVVDTGTATTFDLVNSEGEYLGGAIAPGLEISKEALFQAASKLRPVDLDFPAQVIGKNTKEQLQIGLVRGYGALIDGLVKAMEAELRQRANIIATGGLASFIKQASNTIQSVEPDLTLSGLSLLYTEYKSGTPDSFRKNRPERLMGCETT